jgi:hypothetical protein
MDCVLSEPKAILATTSDAKKAEALLVSNINNQERI